MTDTVDKIVIQAETQGVQQSTADVQGLSKAMDGVTVASQTVEKSTGSIDSKFASLERRFGTTAGQAAQLAKVQQTVNAAVAANPALQDQANEVLAAAALRYGSVTKATEELGHASEGLTGQQQALLHAARSATEGLLAGAPATQIVAQQFGHLSYASTGPGGLTEAFSGVAKTMGGLVTGIGAFITPTTVAIAGAVAMAAAAAAAAVQFDRLQVSSQRAISGAGQRTGTSVSDINAFTSQNSGLAGTSLSTKEARGLAEDFTKTGEIVISRLHGMSDAVVGFANQSGKSIDEARKDIVSFAVDPQKGLEELSKTYGSFDVSTRKAVDALVLADDKTGAFQVVIDALSDKSKAAAGNMGVFEKATRSVVNVLSTEATKPVGLEQQLENVRAKLNTAIESAPDMLNTGEASQNVEMLSKEFESLYQAVQKVKAANASAEFNKLSTAADDADKALIPQIAQLEQVRAKIEALNKAKAAGATSKYGADVDQSAQTAAENLEKSLVDSQAQAARFNDRVKEISVSWGDVGQSTALALQSAQNQLPVLEAVGGGARMAAQSVADYKNYMDQGKSATEAAALAASNLAAAQAQVNSSAQATLASLQDQAAVAGARTAQQSIQAQGQATYNQLLREGVDAETALAVAQQQVANAQTAISVQMDKSVQASRDQLALAQTQGTADQAEVKASIAYRNAIEAGASASQAAAIAANTGAVAQAQWADQAQRYAEAMENAARAAQDAQYADLTPGGDNSFSYFQTKAGIEGNTAATIPYAVQQQFMNTSTPLGVTDQINAILGKGGDINAAISSIQGMKPGTVTANAAQGLEMSLGYQPGQLGASKSTTITESDLISAMQSLVAAKNSQTTDKTQQAANLNDELAWLQSQPQSLATVTAISSLKSSIDSLTSSTNGLNSTNQDLLSPYYSQDPRTSHIGFRSQGMATGGEFTVPGGYSANDNMLAQIPVASGEIVAVRRPGQNLGGGNTQQINMGGIHITVQGGGGQVDANAIGRTVYQAAQTAAKQLAMAGR